MNYFNLISTFVKQYPWRILLTFAISLMAQVFAVFLPIYIARSYDLLFGIQSQRARFLTFIPEDWLATFKGYFTLFLVVVLLRGLLDFAERYGIAVLGELHLSFLRKKLFAHQLRVDMSVYEDKGTGKYLLRYSGDLTSIQAFVNKGMIRFVSDFVLLLLSFFIFFSLGEPIGWTVLGMVVVLSLATYLLNQKLYSASVKRRNAKSGLLKFVASRLKALWTIKSFNRFVPEMGRYEKRVDKLLKLGKGYQRLVGIIGAIIPVGLYLLIGMVMWVTHYLKKTSPEVVDPESFFIALLLLITLIPVFRRSLRVSIVWRNGSISYQKLADILNLPLENTSAKKAQLQWNQGHLSVKGLSFSYPGQARNIFKNFDLEVPANTTTWIHGSAGAGKTTLLKLLGGGYSVTSGQILIDDQNIRSIKTKALRRKIAIIDSSCRLLGRTIFEAVSYSRKSAQRIKVQRVLDDLGLSESLPLDSCIGEDGCRLSQGQYRLLLYARAFLTQKPILLIDEPFVHLDGTMKQTVLSYLNRLQGHRTLLLFTSSTISNDFNIDQKVTLSVSDYNGVNGEAMNLFSSS